MMEQQKIYEKRWHVLFFAHTQVISCLLVYFGARNKNWGGELS